jgi:predicted acetyltransferase
MTVALRDARRSTDDRRFIGGLYPEYLDELGAASQALGTGVFPVYGEHGPRHEELLAPWFRDERSHPLVILKDGRPSGFALVSTPLVQTPDGYEFRMAEFYIGQNARRRGIGRAAATLIFSRFAGRWEVSEAAANQRAVRFWRQTVAAYTQGRYDERLRDGEVRQRFTSAHRALAD